MASDLVTSSAKPVVEVLVEGELSPFEHEALYQLLRKRFVIEQPSYTELPDEDLATRVNITFHHQYNVELFTDILREDWRDLKEILKQIRHRRGRAGAAFSIVFLEGQTRLMFKLGKLSVDDVSSAIEQVGYLTGIVGRMMRSGLMKEDLQIIECSFDAKANRWDDFKGFVGPNKERGYRFDESNFEWMALAE